ncbi:hypothetical protein V2E24_03285 [Mycoplasmopsis ciconiae]|uniref:Uncharacterized protein n=1 Tax=Mycoplasmopsis ciconiae TaxID=561067 RepID=A0ABU7MM27_9BACT|nr:hypothetical protein [Mycoplasmopsis ciconiae]
MFKQFKEKIKKMHQKHLENHHQTNMIWMGISLFFAVLFIVSLFVPFYPQNQKVSYAISVIIQVVFIIFNSYFLYICVVLYIRAKEANAPHHSLLLVITIFVGLGFIYSIFTLIATLIFIFLIPTPNKK